MNFYSLMADLLVVIHAIWVGIVVLGLLAILAGAAFRWRWIRNFWFRVIHLGMIAVVVCEALLGIPCPLTVWEYRLREAAGQTVQEGTFIGRCVHDLLFYDFPPWVFTVVYCIFGGIVLGTMVLIPPSWPRRRAKPPAE
jgi:hypothetical protein